MDFLFVLVPDGLANINYNDSTKTVENTNTAHVPYVAV